MSSRAEGVSKVFSPAGRNGAPLWRRPDWRGKGALKAILWGFQMVPDLNLWKVKLKIGKGEFMNKLILILSMGLAFSTVGCIKGPQGDAGVPGPAGTSVSVQDIQATSGKIVSTINCDGQLPATGYASIDSAGIGVEYNAILTASGDVYATATIYDSGYQAASTSFYAAGQNGASDAKVLVTADYYGASNGGLWKVSLNRETLETKVVYDDSNLPSNLNWTFASTACTVKNW